jgi:hypothetical protein
LILKEIELFRMNTCGSVDSRGLKLHKNGAILVAVWNGEWRPQEGAGAARSIPA